MLENLPTPAPKVIVPEGWSPGITFDGDGGEATLPAVAGDIAPDIQGFLHDAGIDPDEVEIIGQPKVSRWQSARPFPLDPQWLTAVKITWVRKNKLIDLPLLFREAKKARPPKNVPVAGNKAFVVAWSDLQVGKVDTRGGTAELLERVALAKERVLAKIKNEKATRIIFCDVGDTIENFQNAADLNQLQSNDLSLMQQIDLATTLAWDFLKDLAKLGEVTYLTVGSNHCQWRIGKARMGKRTDDWAVHIGRTLARLSHEVGLGIKFIEPQADDESLAHDIFGDNYHILGLWHGHQASNPNSVPDWWRKQAFGNQPVASATIGLSGHFHHLRVQELGVTPRGSSRFWVQATTMDNGSKWYRLNSGEDSQPGITCFSLEQGKDFTGTVWKL